MKRCTKCVLPETHETIVFDEAGVCNICRQHEYKQGTIDWKAKKKEFDVLVSEYRGKHDYDCIVPFSGGKDSTWTLYYLMKEYNLKPWFVLITDFLGSTFETTRQSLRKLGVDMHVFTPNWKVVQKLMLLSFWKG
jgi:tRNA(Ile)-lysidine synthase TilS/MesJ